MRRNPMLPSTPPSTSPAASSRRMTRHQSRSRTSPSAIARMTSVDACDPELPPLEMISGTNRASTTARAISVSKKAIAVGRTAQLLDVLRGFLFDDGHHVVRGDDTLHPAFLVHDRCGDQAVFGEQVRDLLLVGGRGNGD